MTIVGGHFAVMLIVSTPASDRTQNGRGGLAARQAIEGLGLEARHRRRGRRAGLRGFAGKPTT